MRLFIHIFLLVLIISTPASANVFNAQMTRLDNGMDVVVIPNTRAPVVHHMVWYKVGSAQEDAGTSGSAHFLEHLLFRGTDKIPDGEFSKIIRGLGGESNAFTSYDYTGYYETVAKEHLARVMGMEADRMRGLTLSDEAVLRERDVVLEERRQRTDNNPTARFFEQMRARLFPDHPYGIPVIGWMDELSGLQKDNALKFYNHYYHPNNAVLVVAGDIAFDDVVKLAQDTYGKIPASQTDLSFTFPTLSSFDDLQTYSYSDPQVSEPLLLIGTRAPSYKQDPKMSLALQVIEEAVSGGPTTPLYNTLVIEQKKAISASLSYSASAADTASLWISVVPVEGETLDALTIAVQDFLADLLQTSLSEEEITNAKTRLKREAIFARDSLRTAPMVIGRALSVGETLQSVETWPEQINAVTQDDIKDALVFAFGEQARQRTVVGQMQVEK